jgi:hypothetical protein
MLFIAKTQVASSSWLWRINIDALVIGVIENEEDEKRVLLSLKPRKSRNAGVLIVPLPRGCCGSIICRNELLTNFRDP